MTERKSATYRVPSQVRKDEATDFPRPDAEQADEGTPAHEQEQSADPKRAASKNDDAHGFSQDSGYQGSGGYAKPNARSVTMETKAKKPGNGHTHSDEQIRSQLQQRLSKERAPRASHLLVSVGQGVVTLRGEVDDELERKRLTDIVRGIGSVRELHDELSTRATRDDIN
jgi:osmotically-inducible protein OsmY